MMAQTQEMIGAKFPAVVADLIEEYFRPWKDGIRGAAKAGCYELAANMLDSSASITALIGGACWGGYIEMVKFGVYMLHKWLPSGRKSSDELMDEACRQSADTWLYSAECSRDRQIIRWCWRWGPDYCKGITGAARIGDQNRVEHLIRSRGAPTLLGHMMYMAGKSGNQALVDRIARLTTDAEPWKRALNGATVRGHIDIVRYALDRGAPSEEAWWHADRSGRQDVVELLIRVTKPSRWAIQSCLKGAVARNHANIVRFILKEHGARQPCSSSFDDLLHGGGSCSSRTSIEIIRMLLDYGDSAYLTFMRLCETGNIRGVTFMLSRSDCPMWWLKDGAIAATKGDHYELAGILLRHLRQRKIVPLPSRGEIEQVCKRYGLADEAPRS